MAEPIEIQVENQQDTIIIHVHGEVDMGTAPMLQKAVLSVFQSQRHVIVDLAHVTYIDMSGFRVLEDGKEALGKGQGFALTASSPLVHKVIEIIQFGKVIPLFPSTQDALDFVRSRDRNNWQANDDTLAGGRAMTWTLSLRLQTDPDAIRAVRQMIYGVVKQEGLSEREAREFELAIGEALSNARTHAYSDGAGPLTVDITSDTSAVEVVVHDTGAPITLPTVPTSLPSDPRAVGLFLVASLVDEVKILRNGSGKGVSIMMMKRFR
jgi:anti-anti-sigma factor